ncbi:MAG: DUF1566 domain-containing protein, partial [Chromatium okenii]|nr:DUF1566 domain-containing protein [Chromatium okenii]
MNSAKSVIATFTVIPTYALTVTTVGNGIVTSDPNGINCSSTCSANFNDGTSVTLFAVGTAGYRFSGWSGACSGTGDCIVTTDAAKSVTAIFTTIPTYTLTVIKNGIDSGTVTSDLTGIDCGATCSANFTDGAWITLTAAPNIGYAFSQWSSECLSLPTNPLQCQINIMAATTVTATFVTAGLNDTGISACSDTNTNGQICPLAAFPDQDAELGRDAENIAGTLIKTGDGNAGFDFTKISNIGAVLPATASLGNGDNDWACTRDNVTGLIWEVKSDSDADFWYMNATYNWGEAVTYYVSNMNDHHRCGFSDWRMPSEKELLGIVDYNQSIPNPTIDSNYFPNTRSYWFWSSSLDVSNSSYAWGVYFGNGYANRANQNNNFHVRLVRGQATVNSFIDNGDTVTQTNTGLMWAKCSAGQTSPECTTGTAIEMAWSDALTAANSSNLGGYSDWRIPNIKELQSLANYDTFNPNLSSYAWYLNVSNGYVSYDLRSAGNHVRFVRDALFLSIIKAGTGSGTVTSDVGGINCGADCIKTYGVGTSVILSAT